MRKRNGFSIMAKLITLIKPLWLLMFFAILVGSIGHLSAILIPTIGITLVFLKDYHHILIPLLILCGVLRGVFRYIEQALNHELAFRVLAQLRDLVFGKMRELAPAKLETKDRGNLITLITSDIEQLEVFFAHTISPVFIALIVNAIVVFLIAKISGYLAIVSLIAYLKVGILIPIVYSSMGREKGLLYRHQLGDLNSFVLDGILGIYDVLQFSQDTKSLKELELRSKTLNNAQKDMNRYSILNHASVELVIFISNMLLIALGFMLEIEIGRLLIALVLHTSSFGPVIALSNLANNMYHTLASGERVLDLLEEKPVVEEVINDEPFSHGPIALKDVNFKYDESLVLKNLNTHFNEHKIIGIQGPSGSGKSTILKLLMRVYEVDSGEVLIHNTNINEIDSKALRTSQALMSQNTDLFEMSIYDNIRLGAWNKPDKVIDAAKKAGIHDFILSLKDGYDTKLAEFGSSLSSGERQRIALARLFMGDTSLLIFDEPTSNLDSLNEAIILKNLQKHKDDKTIILTSHRLSTMNIADERYEFIDGVLSKLEH